jgi:spectrin alpha
VTFESGLQAFEQEGVQKVTTLKDDLVKAQHAQSPAIMGRSDELVQR